MSRPNIHVPRAKPVPRWVQQYTPLVVLLLIAALLIAGPAGAVHDEAFQLDGDTDPATGDTDPPVDWETLFESDGTALPRPAGFVDSNFFADHALPDDTVYQGGGSKDDLAISSWACTSKNNLGDKFDLQNTYATAYTNTAGDTILYVAGSRASNNGNTNIGVWFLQDNTVDCSSQAGTTGFTGAHEIGDVFIVAELTNGGGVANLIARRVDGFDSDGDPILTQIASGIECSGVGPGDPDKLCAEANAGPINTPWPPGDTTALESPQFFELGINLPQNEIDECFNRVLTNTRSSQSVDSVLHDFGIFELNTCATLTVEKYIDANMNGTFDSGTDVAGQGWSFVVTDSEGTEVCSGTTDSNGQLECGSLKLGDYTITETQKTGFHNTDPGPADPDTLADTVNRSSPVSKTVTLGGDQTERLGNTCYVDKTFQINNVDSGVNSVTVDWDVTSGPDAADATFGEGSVSLSDTDGDGDWTGTVEDVLVQTQTIDWEWYVDGNDTDTVVGATGESLSGGAYPTCALTNEDDFPFATLSGSKLKDGNADGDLDDGVDGTGLAGFTFELVENGTVIDTAVSDSNGDYQFANVGPGTYTVREKHNVDGDPFGKTDWLQTVPADDASGNPGTRSITVTLGDTTGTIDDFGNAPLSRVKVEFEDLTGFTQGSIDCPDAIGDASSSTGETEETESVQASDLPPGTYNCTVTITDP